MGINTSTEKMSYEISYTTSKSDTFTATQKASASFRLCEIFSCGAELTTAFANSTGSSKIVKTTVHCAPGKKLRLVQPGYKTIFWSHMSGGKEKGDVKTLWLDAVKTIEEDI